MLLFGRHGNPFAGHNTKLLMVRGIAGCISFLAVVYAVRTIPISTALVLFYSYPAFAALFSALTSRENVMKQIFWALFAFCGVAVFLDTKMEGGLLGQSMSLVGAAFAGVAMASIRKARETNGPVIIYLYFCLTGAAISFIPFVYNPQVPACATDWWMVGGIVSTSVVAQLLMNQGFQYCTACEGGAAADQRGAVRRHLRVRVTQREPDLAFLGGRADDPREYCRARPDYRRGGTGCGPEEGMTFERPAAQRVFDMERWKVFPFSCPGSTQTLPWCLSAISFTIASPRPRAGGALGCDGSLKHLENPLAVLRFQAYSIIGYGEDVEVLGFRATQPDLAQLVSAVFQGVCRRSCGTHAAATPGPPGEYGRYLVGPTRSAARSAVPRTHLSPMQRCRSSRWLRWPGALPWPL